MILGSDKIDRIKGGAGDDALHGGGGSDWLDGGEGDDVVAGGGGLLDLVWGGAGADVFAFGAETSDGHRDRTVIGDFEVGTDAIDLGGTEVARHKSLARLAGPHPGGGRGPDRPDRRLAL